MADTREEDLFSSSSMSFGDHLDELRTCLFKAVLGLAVGTLIGFLVGKYVVAFIQNPLQEGLIRYYKDGAVLEYEKFAKERRDQSLPVPYTEKQVEHLVRDKQLIFTIYRVHHSALKAAAPTMVATAKPAVGVGADAADSSEDPDKAAIRAIDAEPLIPVFAWRPMTSDERISVKAFSIQEPFMIWLKGSLLAGVVLSSPWIFYQLWIFVAAGLYPRERRYVHIYLPFSIGLFLAGALLCFFGVFPLVLKFLLQYGRDLGIAPELRMNEWLGFALWLPVGFGISFQLPLVMLFLNRIGLFTIEQYWSKWRIAVLVIFVIAMVLTPADPYSMLMMALPLTGLYFAGILLCQYMRPPKSLLER